MPKSSVHMLYLQTIFCNGISCDDFLKRLIIRSNYITTSHQRWHVNCVSLFLYLRLQTLFIYVDCVAIFKDLEHMEGWPVPNVITANGFKS